MDSSTEKGDKAKIYVTKSLWNGEIDHALVLDCSDPRLASARMEFLSGYCGLGRYDSIIVPSGPTCMTVSEVTFLFDRQRVQMLHGIHQFKRAIGIAHHDCAYYKNKYPDHNEVQKCERQHTDLKKFRTDIQSMIPGVRVDLFYAAPNKEGFVAYTKIS
ncbi:MAG: hypothetical protein Q8R29_02445 [bacterium]|nr:hypothetical protein [bacterium]